MSGSNNHPNRDLTPEQRKEREDRRALALQIAGQVCKGSGISPTELARYAEKLVGFVRDAKVPE